MLLRPYQQETLDASLKKYNEGCRRQIVCWPTGSGKTVLAANIMKHHQLEAKKMLFLVHREELANQAVDKIKAWNPTYSIGVEMAERESSTENNVVVASVPTIGTKRNKRIHKYNPDDFGIIITDESHHATAPSYKYIYNYFGALKKSEHFNENHPLMLGITATPNRSDGAGLIEVFDEIVYEYPILKAIDQGWLVDVIGFKVVTETSLDEVHTRLGDFAQEELGNTVNNYSRNKLIVDNWKKQGEERSTVVFCASVQHAQDLASVFKDNGICAEAIWGEDQDRHYKLEAHRAGNIKILTNFGILIEGYDDSSIACIVLARPTKSQLLFTQMIGRGLRLQAGITNQVDALSNRIPVQKQNCLIIDVADNTEKHSLISLNSLFGVPPKVKLQGKSAVQAFKLIQSRLADHPTVDLSNLENLEDIDHYIEQVDLFKVVFDTDVEKYSQLQWHKQGTNYALSASKLCTVILTQNLLGKWDGHGLINGNIIQFNVDSIKEAFYRAEQAIIVHGHEFIKLLKRKASWHKADATDAQRKLLQRLMRNLPASNRMLNQLSKGEASQLINKLLLERRKIA